jgi:hypothetical protein
MRVRGQRARIRVTRRSISPTAPADASASARRQLAREHGQNRIVPQLIVVVQVFVAQRQPEHALADQRLDPVLDVRRRALVGEAAGKARHQPDRPVRRAQQQGTGIRRDHPAVERRHHRTPVDACKAELIRVTLRLHRGLL